MFDSSTLHPTHRKDILNGEAITYYNKRLREKLPKYHVEYRVRGTYGGNRSNYTGPVSNNTAEYPVVKILLNATLSDRIHKDKNTKFATADMVDFYLGTDLDQPGYTAMSADDIGDELIDLYNLRDYIVTTAKGRFIYFKVVKCLYGHPSSGRLSFLKLKGILEEGGFHEHPMVDCLFIHKTRNIMFYEASDMILTAQSDASFQNIPGSLFKAGGFSYFGNKGDPPTKNNGQIGVFCRTISVVCAAASDAEYAALFSIAQLIYFYRIVSDACGYPQQDPSPIYVDNDVARGIANRSVKVSK